MFRPPSLRAAVLTAVALAATAAPSRADFFRGNAGFEANTLPGNDDGSTGSVAIGFNINFFGNMYSNLFVNNNGNVTFNAPLGTFTPFNLLSTATPILAPFFGDVDTRPNLVGDDVTYGTDVVNGHAAFGVNWDGVGYFSFGTDRLNSFQLVIIDRADTGAGNFDFEFNYQQIQWETGGASGGSGGLGGNSARAGWSNGVANSFELPGSAINGAFLDGGPNELQNSSNIGVRGQWLFSVRNGQVVTTTPVPATAVAALVGVLGLVPVARRRAKAAA